MFQKSGMSFLKEKPKKMWAEVKYSHRAIVIFDLIMFPYPTRSKKIRF